MNDDRIRRSFDELRRQASGADPEVHLMRLTQPAQSRQWSLAIAAAAVVIVVVGSVAILLSRSDRNDVIDPIAPISTTTSTSPTTTSPSSTTTVSPTSGATTTTTPTTSAPPSSTPAPNVSGWHVVGVASDDVLNVREGPGTQFTIVGELAPNAVDVTVMDQATSNLDGNDPWVGVRLDNGVTGWVNQRFLAQPPSWFDGVADIPCSASEPGTATAASGGNGSASSVLAIAELPGADCTRYVIVFGDGEEVLTEADSLSGEVRVTSGTSRVDVGLPPAVTGVSQYASGQWLGETLALAIVPVGSPDTLEVRFLNPSSRVASVTTLSNPARVVIDVASAPTGSGLDLRPLIGGPVILESRVDTSVDQLGVGNQITVRGYARFFEATGSAEVTTGGEPPTDIAWGGASLTGSADNVGFLMAPWSPTWGEFEFTVDLTAGSYELYVSSCVADPAEQPICGVRDSFDVAP